MGGTACTEHQCLYKGALYLTFIYITPPAKITASELAYFFCVSWICFFLVPKSDAIRRQNVDVYKKKTCLTNYITRSIRRKINVGGLQTSEILWPILKFNKFPNTKTCTPLNEKIHNEE